MLCCTHALQDVFYAFVTESFAPIPSVLDPSIRISATTAFVPREQEIHRCSLSKKIVISPAVSDLVCENERVRPFAINGAPDRIAQAFIKVKNVVLFGSVL